MSAIKSSPATFLFRVENTLPIKATILIDVRNDNPDCAISLSDYKFIVEDYDCARTIQATATPLVPMAPGRKSLFFVTAYASAWGSELWVETGGVALKARIAPPSVNLAPSHMLLLGN